MVIMGKLAAATKEWLCGNSCGSIEIRKRHRIFPSLLCYDNVPAGGQLNS